MSGQAKLSWAAIVGAIAAALTIASFVARSIAQAEVAPVDRRVTAVETKQQATDKQLDSIDKKIDRLIEMHLTPAPPRRTP